MSTVEWESYEGATFAYLDDGREVEITARARGSRWGDIESNVRQWYVRNDANAVIASGKADGLRAAKSAALAFLAQN